MLRVETIDWLSYWMCAGGCDLTTMNIRCIIFFLCVCKSFTIAQIGDNFGYSFRYVVSALQSFTRAARCNRRYQAVYFYFFVEPLPPLTSITHINNILCCVRSDIIIFCNITESLSISTGSSGPSYCKAVRWVSRQKNTLFCSYDL